MNGGTAATIDDSLYSNWLPSGVWQGLFSGAYDDGLYGQNTGYYWSSTAISTSNTFYLVTYDTGFTITVGSQDHGYAVRCTI